VRPAQTSPTNLLQREVNIPPAPYQRGSVSAVQARAVVVDMEEGVINHMLKVGSSNPNPNP